MPLRSSIIQDISPSGSFSFDAIGWSCSIIRESILSGPSGPKAIGRPSNLLLLSTGSLIFFKLRTPSSQLARISSSSLAIFIDLDLDLYLIPRLLTASIVQSKLALIHVDNGPGCLIRFGLDKFGCIINKAEIEILRAALGLHSNRLQHPNI